MPSRNGRTDTSSRTPPRSVRATPSRSASRTAGFEFTSTRNRRNHDRRAELRGIPRGPRGDGGCLVPRRPAARPRPRRLRGRTRPLSPLPRDPRGLRAARDEADRRGRGTHRRTVPRRVISAGLPFPMPAERRSSQVPGDFIGHLFLVNDPPWLLVPDPAAGSAAALSDRFVILLDRDRLLRDVRDRDVGEVFAHPGQLLLRVPERREERLSGPAEEADVLPCVRLLVSLEELRDAHLPFAVSGADAGCLAREEHDPFVAALELDREADGTRNVLADLLDRICVRGGPQPDGIDDAVHDLVAVGFRNLHRADEDVPRVRVDCLVALDASEAGIFISLIPETIRDKEVAFSNKSVEFLLHFETIDELGLRSDLINLPNTEESQLGLDEIL